MKLLLVLIFTVVLSASAAPSASAQVPGLEFIKDLPTGAHIKDILPKFYQWGVTLVVISSFIMLIFGGVRYMTAGDKDPTAAKQWMKQAVYGLLLALVSYIILYTINPELTKTKLELQTLTAPPRASGPGRVEEGQSCSKSSTNPAETCRPDLVCAKTWDLIQLCYYLGGLGPSYCRQASQICSSGF